jgi:hypothetical protein
MMYRLLLRVVQYDAHKINAYKADSSPLHHSAPSNPTRQFLPALYKASKKSSLYTFTLKMATAMSAETLDNNILRGVSLTVEVTH